MLVEELRRIKEAFKSTDQASLVNFSQSSAPRVGQIYLAVAENTSATLKQRVGILSSLY